MGYDYDLVKVTPISSSQEKILFYEFEMTITDRKFGAVIKNGPPYKADVCIDNKPGDMPIIDSLQLLKVIGGKEYIQKDASINLNNNWNNSGAISCLYNILEFDEAIDNKIEFCIDAVLNWQGNNISERQCFVFGRERGKGKMSLDNIMKQ